MTQAIDNQKVIELAKRAYRKVEPDEPIHIHQMDPAILTRYGATTGFVTTSDTTLTKHTAEPGMYVDKEVEVAGDLTMESLSDDLATYAIEVAQAIYNEYCRRELELVDGGEILRKCQYYVQFYDDKLRELRAGIVIPELEPSAPDDEYAVSLVIENMGIGAAWLMRAGLIYHCGPVGQYMADPTQCRRHTIIIPHSEKKD